MIWEITTHELLTRYNSGERNFVGVEFIKDPERHPEDLGIGEEIHGLQNTNLTGINLRGANLTGIQLQKANLRGGNFFGAAIVGANLSYANFTGAILDGANLTHSSFYRADLGNTSLIYTNAHGTRFVEASVDTFENSILIDANFMGANTSKSQICRFGNFIYRTTMPDGTVENGPSWGI